MTFERSILPAGVTLPGVVSMQSHVAHGHVGNAVAQFVLQRSGCEVVPLHTVLYSSHLGYPEWRGRTRHVDELSELIEGLEAIGALASRDALLTGFLGDVEHAMLALDLHATHMPGSLMCVDPVMGDHGHLYVREELVEIYREVMPGKVDVLLPNMFELELLTRMPVRSVPLASEALEALADRHRQADAPGGERDPTLAPLLVVKGVQDEDFPEDLFVLARLGEDELILKAPKLGGFFAGAGDLFSATLVANLLRGVSIRVALEHAMRATFYVLVKTRELGRRELALISSQSIFDRAWRPEASQEGSAEVVHMKWRHGKRGESLVAVSEEGGV